MSVFWKKPKRLCKDSVGYILKVFGRCYGKPKTSYSSRQYTSETNIKLSVIHEADSFDRRRCYCAVYDANGEFLYLLKYTDKYTDNNRNEFKHIEMSEFPQCVTDYQAKYKGELIDDEHSES
jgi:hypothetical protein